MSDVFDLDALDAEGEPFRFSHKGKEYALPADIDLTTVGVLDAGDFERVMQRLLGEETWKGIVEAGGFGVRKLLKLLDAYGKHLGVGGLGGFRASADS